MISASQTPLPVAFLDKLHHILSTERNASSRLRDAALAGQLRPWTTELSAIIVLLFHQLGYSASAKGHKGSALPVPRGEYLSHDVMAFGGDGIRWHQPFAVCELENSAQDKYVEYALWKVLCVRCELRVVFCYRPSAVARADLIKSLQRRVVAEIPVTERQSFKGDTLVIVGSRDEPETFPYGFFSAWILDYNTGSFTRFYGT